MAFYNNGKRRKIASLNIFISFYLSRHVDTKPRNTALRQILLTNQDARRNSIMTYRKKGPSTVLKLARKIRERVFMKIKIRLPT